MKAKIFAGHKCTTGLHNALLDVVMPELPANAWKVLCVIIRQTTGWERDEIGIGYDGLMQGAGIKGKATIAAALEDLTSYRYELIKVTPGTQHQMSTYRVNREVEIDWTPVDFDDSTSTKNEALSSSKSEPLKAARSSKTEPLSSSKTEPLSKSRSSVSELSYRKELLSKREREREAEKKLGDDEGKKDSGKTQKAALAELEKTLLTTYRISSVPNGTRSRLDSDLNDLLKNGVTPDELTAFFASRRKRLPSIGFIATDLLKWRLDVSWSPAAAPPVVRPPVCPLCDGAGLVKNTATRSFDRCSCKKPSATNGAPTSAATGTATGATGATGRAN